MAKETTIYKATDGTLFTVLDEASAYQRDLNSSPTNPVVRQAFFDAAKRLPKYGKYVEKSKNEFLRAVNYSNPVELCRDLLFNYTSSIASVFEARDQQLPRK